MNNLNLGVLADVMQRGQTDPSVFSMHKRIEGDWDLTVGRPAFTATVAHGQASSVLNVDIAPGFGGQGLAPDPLQYLLTGLGACYAATVVTLASMEGATIQRLHVTAEQDVNVSAVYDMGDAPLMEQITVSLAITADVDDETLTRWQDAARAKCPFVYTIANPIPLTTTITRA